MDEALEPVKESSAGDLPVRVSPEGCRGITIPVMREMGALPKTYYAADADGYIHVPLAARPHAEWANWLFRQEDKAIATHATRKENRERRVNSMSRIEAAIERSVGGHSDVAGAVAAAVAGLMPALMKEMRDQVRAEMLEAQQAPAPQKDGGGGPRK